MRSALTILALLLLPLAATAGEYRQIHAAWDYDDANGEVAGFRLYYQGGIVCETYEPQARAIDCEVLVAGYPASFTAVAYDRSGREGAHSEPSLLEQRLSANTPPVALLRAEPATGAAPHPVSFDGAASYDREGGPIGSYAWDFGDGGTGEGAQVSHTYADEGEYPVTLTVTDQQYAIGQARATVMVTGAAVPAGAPPVPAIAAEPLDGPAPLPVRFSGQAGSGGEPFEFLWDFGDGTTKAGQNVEHVFTVPGNHMVALTVTGRDGATARSEVALAVRENAGSGKGFAFNFQPGQAPVPEGYAEDTGAPFNSLAGFGWTVPPGDLGARDRNSSRSPDQALDTFIHVAPGAVWEQAVPNGRYVVTLAAGDPTHPEGRQQVQVEGVDAISGAALSSASPWVERAVLAVVEDGRLTLTFAGSEPVAKLARVRVDQADSWRPLLYGPADGAAGIGRSAQLTWSPRPTRSNWSSFRPVTYTLVYGTDPLLQEATAAGPGNPGDVRVLLAGICLAGGAGLAARGGRRTRWRPAMALAGAGLLLSSCGGGGGGGGEGAAAPPVAAVVTSSGAKAVGPLEANSFQAEGLQAGTTYYWQVVADDGQKQVASEISSFTTQ